MPRPPSPVPSPPTQTCAPSGNISPLALPRPMPWPSAGEAWHGCRGPLGRWRTWRIGTVCVEKGGGRWVWTCCASGVRDLCRFAPGNVRVSFWLRNTSNPRAWHTLRLEGLIEANGHVKSGQLSLLGIDIRNAYVAARARSKTTASATPGFPPWPRMSWPN